MTRVIHAALVLSLFAGATACDDSPTAPTEETITLTAQLLPANEVPPVTNAEASGSGTALIVMDIDRDANGAITDATANFQVTLTGFPDNTPVTGAHIHTGGPGVVGGVLVNTGLTPGDVTLLNGSGGFTRSNISDPGGLDTAVAEAIIANPGNYYFNVHSVQNPAGMARGQLVRQP